MPLIVIITPSGYKLIIDDSDSWEPNSVEWTEFILLSESWSELINRSLIDDDIMIHSVKWTGEMPSIVLYWIDLSDDNNLAVNNIWCPLKRILAHIRWSWWWYASVNDDGSKVTQLNPSDSVAFGTDVGKATSLLRNNWNLTCCAISSSMTPSTLATQSSKPTNVMDFMDPCVPGRLFYCDDRNYLKVNTIFYAGAYLWINKSVEVHTGDFVI